ncbi:MAG: hypothetical protein J3K34DRAFT_411526 [Monoraphidium minutum]|nr:MAG: hypothetical protein J3K34DRAFT_411526 [Monoraphidium minutum]
MAPKSRLKPAARTIKQLQASLQRLQVQIEALGKEQEWLTVRRCGAALRLRHCDTLLAVAAGLRGGEAAAEMRAALRSAAGAGADAVNGGATCCCPPLGWSPELALDIARREDLSRLLTTPGLRREIRLFASSAGVLVQRVRFRAPDAGRAAEELGRLRARLCALVGLGLLVGDLMPLSEVLTRALDEDDPEAAADGAAALRPPAADVPLAHWLWAAAQLKLSPSQEEHVSIMLEVHCARQQQLQARIVELLQRCAAAGDLGARGALVEELTAAQRLFQVENILTSLSVYTLVRADQFAAYWVAAWPYAPTVLGLNNTLKLLRERRGASEAPTAAAMAAAASSGGSARSGGGCRDVDCGQAAAGRASGNSSGVDDRIQPTDSLMRL